MGSLYILLPVALIFFCLMVALFFWAVGDNQFDDLDKEGQRILFDSDPGETKDQPRSKTEIEKSSGPPHE
tara:strand:- start:7302 stop:7511 length:210 start_codon:yes stop_codon:yes gene_type:complete